MLLPGVKRSYKTIDIVSYTLKVSENGDICVFVAHFRSSGTSESNVCRHWRVSYAVCLPVKFGTLFWILASKHEDIQFATLMM